MTTQTQPVPASRTRLSYRSGRRSRWRLRLLDVVMTATSLVVFIPLYVLVNLAVRRSDDLSSPLVPTRAPTLTNLGRAWVEGALGNSLVNSLVVTACSVVLVVLTTALASYPLVRVSRRWSRGAAALFLLGLLLPFQLSLIPLYKTMDALGLLGNLAALVIYYTGLQVPFGVFIYTQFLRGIPTDYEEAAQIDGANALQTFWLVVFPLLRPVTGTLVILTAISVWNDFFVPLLYLSGSGNQTATVALYSYVGQYTANWNIVFSGLLITIAPILLTYFVLQRSIIKGFGGGLKG